MLKVWLVCLYISNILAGVQGDHSQVWMVSLPEHDPYTHTVDILSYDINSKCLATKVPQI